MPVFILAAIGLGAYFLLASGDDKPGSPPPVPEGNPYLDDYRHLTWLLREKWSWLEMREEQGLDLEALEAEAADLSRVEPGARGFLRGLTRYVAGISDGHAHAMLAGVDLQEERRWPFSLVEVEEGLMVDGVDSVTAGSKVLERGDLVLAVDDTPIDELIRRQGRFVFASTPAARRYRAISALTESTADTSYRVRILPLGGTQEETVEVDCPSRAEPVPRHSWRPIREKYTDLDADTAYFCVGKFVSKDRSFADASPEERTQVLAGQYDGYAEIFSKVSRKSALILDLRGNPGGTDLLGQALACHLMEPGFLYFQLASKIRGRWIGPNSHRPEVGRGEPRYLGRIACLIDERVFSVADNFASCLRDQHPDIRFFGQPTGGGSGAPRPFTLPSTKAQVRFCTMRVWAPNDTYVEGNGVTPDVFVRPSREQVLAGKDTVLEAAVKSLRQ